MKRLAICMSFLLIFIITGCGEPKIYSPMFKLEDTLYVVTNAPVDEEEIEKEIGSIEKETKNVPIENGEGYKIKKGTVLFKIKGKDITGDRSKGQAGIVAFLDEDGQYRDASMYWSDKEIKDFKDFD
ncbi:hypothetical protein [Sporosarcina sp. FSL K6-3457]|uniref:hypothetical protein n=1 Tax=Sporosarcina sp. FSL K6-3457 TaxID=2978204 RepID=UPI0030FC23BB